jgi:putative ABC transport system permease protein
MGFAQDSDLRQLIELKGVDAAYPLFGAVKIDREIDLPAAFALADGRYGALVEENLLGRLELSVGDVLRVGATTFDVRGIIEDEPDRVAGGFRYGPRVMVASQALKETGLVQLGSLIRYHYRLALPDEAAGDEVLEAFKTEANEAYPAAGWRIQDRHNSAPGTSFFIDRVSMFLTLVGLAALIVGGVGVGNAVKSYLDRKQEVIATFKCLGADGRTIFAIYLVQVLALATIAIFCGLIVGSLVPFGLASVYGDVLPIPVRLGIYPSAMLQATSFGYLVTIGFATWPLARARQESPASLFRELVGGHEARLGWKYWSVILGSLAVLAATAILLSSYPPFSAFFIGGMTFAFLFLLGVAWGLTWVLKRMPRPRWPMVRMALGNLHRPGAPTPSVILSMGLGLTLVVTVSLIEGNLDRQISRQIPDEAPAFFFVDIQKNQIDEITQLMAGFDGASDFTSVPSLRGSILSINGTPTSELEVDPDVAWVIRGDRSLTYSATVPDGSEVVAGEWWAEDYSGSPQISMEAEIAAGLGVEVGGELTLSVLGRELSVQVVNLRQLDWQTPDFNYVIVFAPGTLEVAPHTYLANVRARADREEVLYLKVTDQFPNVTVIRVKEALRSISDVLSDLTMGVRITSLVTVLAGLLVLAGALAAGHRRRLYDAVILKTLGATRGWIIRVYMLEFAMLGLLTAFIAACLGTLAAYLVVTLAMESDWTFLGGRLIVTIALATGVSVLLGLAGTWTTLSAKVAPVLRTA